MSTSAAPDHADPGSSGLPGNELPGSPSGTGLDCQIPANAYSHLIRTLRRALPPPPTDSAEDLLRRDHAAIARIAALAPANATGADLAAQFVAASEQWKDCLRLAQEPETLPGPFVDTLTSDGVPAKSRDLAGRPDRAAKCRAQALSMMRQANTALRLLMAMQGARRRLEADGAACDRLAWTEHVATRLMAEALAHHPHPDPNQLSMPSPAEAGAHSADEPAEPCAPTCAEAKPPAPPAIPEPEPALTGAAASRRLKETDPDLIAAAERYAATYPERAAQIRRTGKLPYDIRYFEPSEFALVRALVAARTPALLSARPSLPGSLPRPPGPEPGLPPRNGSRLGTRGPRGVADPHPTASIQRAHFVDAPASWFHTRGRSDLHVLPGAGADGR